MKWLRPLKLSEIFQNIAEESGLMAFGVVTNIKGIGIDMLNATINIINGIKVKFVSDYTYMSNLDGVDNEVEFPLTFFENKDTKKKMKGILTFDVKNLIKKKKAISAIRFSSETFSVQLVADEITLSTTFRVTYRAREIKLSTISATKNNEELFTSSQIALLQKEGEKYVIKY